MAGNSSIRQFKFSLSGQKQIVLLSLSTILSDSQLLLTFIIFWFISQAFRELCIVLEQWGKYKNFYCIALEYGLHLTPLNIY